MKRSLPAFSSLCLLLLSACACAQTIRPGGVSIREVDDYVFGGYRGRFTSPPSADGNPRRAFIVTWRDRPYRFVFSHEGSYCPWFELADGSGVEFTITLAGMPRRRLAEGESA